MHPRKEAEVKAHRKLGLKATPEQIVKIRKRAAKRRK